LESLAVQEEFDNGDMPGDDVINDENWGLTEEMDFLDDAGNMRFDARPASQ
jgi:hypothetical protein